VGVFLVAGCGADLLINILLTILGYVLALIPSTLIPTFLQSSTHLNLSSHAHSYFPGHIHAFYVEYVYYKRRDEIRAGTYDGSLAPGVYGQKVQNGGQRSVVAQPAPAGMPPAQQGYGATAV
jgi:uncharacterized membrane protein YqaE (UPF0057 family)